jgi:uncharacterized protein
VPNFINKNQYLTEFNVHRKYAQSDLLLDLVWTHCNIVAEIAHQLLLKNNLDPVEYNPGIVYQAGLLHDVGVYVCDGFEWLPGQPPRGKPYIQHTLAGAWILKQEGFCPDVIQCAHVHSGMGITNQDIRKFILHLPEGDYVPTTPVQKIITYAAKFHSKIPRFRKADEIKGTLERYGQEKVKLFEDLVEEYSEPDLEKIEEKYQDWHKWFTYQTSQLTNSMAPKLNSAGMIRRD